MIEFNAFVRNPLAPRIFVNDIGGIYRLDGGIMQVTFVQKYQDGSNLNAVEQGSLIWPEANWFHYAGMLHWAKKEIERGTFSNVPQLRPH
jgi:hypothetical protein